MGENDLKMPGAGKKVKKASMQIENMFGASLNICRKKKIVKKKKII